MTIELKQFEAKDFMGIDQSNPVVIDFTKARKGQNVVTIRGDQGTNKTSTITALMYLMGAAFNVDMKSFVNLNDEALDVKLEFEDSEGNQYKAEATTSRLTLKQFFKTPGKFVSVDSPKATLRKIFGNLGVSPMFLKEVEGKKQIEWFKETFGSDEEAGKKEKRLIENLQTLTDQRREVNRDIKRVKGALESEPLYINYEESQEKFKSAPSPKKEKEKYDELREKNEQYQKAKDGLTGLKSSLKEKQNEIQQLEQRLADLRKSEETIATRISDGEKYINDNKNIPKEFEAANDEWMNLSKKMRDHDNWKEIVKRKKELDELEDASVKADGQIDKIRLDLRKLTKGYLPEIEGLEIKLKTGIEDTQEGIFYNEKSMAQLSESELWDLFERIWEQKNVQFIFCENVTSLGSEAIKTLNRLVKEKKAQVFATEMDRKKNTSEIIFSAKID